MIKSNFKPCLTVSVNLEISTPKKKFSVVSVMSGSREHQAQYNENILEQDLSMFLLFNIIIINSSCSVFRKKSCLITIKFYVY